MLVRTESGRLLNLGDRLGAGGEGAVFAVDGAYGEVVKLFHADRESGERKLERLSGHPPTPTGTRTQFAWPTERIYSPNPGRLLGYVMPKASGRPLHVLTNLKDRLTHAGHLHWGQLLAVAQNVSNLVHALHDAGYVAGDINEGNFFVDLATGAVTMVDCDSIQAVGDQGELFACEVGKPDFAPPESQGPRDGRALLREHDRFALAILVSQLVLECTHPFAGVDDHPESDFAARIRRGATPFLAGTGTRSSPFAPPLTLLDDTLGGLVQRTFGVGLRNPTLRPTPAEWSQALADCRARLVACPSNSAHRFVNRDERCPWCQRTRLLRRDPYPSPVIAVPAPPEQPVAMPVAWWLALALWLLGLMGPVTAGWRQRLQARLPKPPAQPVPWTRPPAPPHLPLRRPAPILRPSPTVYPAPTPATVRQPIGHTLVGSRHSKYFHTPACSWAGRILARNAVTFANPTAARQQGRTPCTTCRP